VTGAPTIGTTFSKGALATQSADSGELSMKRNRFRSSIIAACFMFLSASLSGQSGLDLGEVSAYGGAGFGPLGTHAWVGATTGVEFSRYALGLIDTSFLPLGSSTLVNRPLVENSRLYDFNFAVHIQIPTKHRWVPYGLAASALLFNTYRVNYLQTDGIIYYHGQSDAKFGFETGGGVRYYIGRNWGVKGEDRYTFSTRNFNRILGGVFYQFEGEWPFLPRGKRRRQYPQVVDPAQSPGVQANTAARIR
jgi:opacity protein-like surface antigen